MGTHRQAYVRSTDPDKYNSSILSTNNKKETKQNRARHDSEYDIYIGNKVMKSIENISIQCLWIESLILCQ